MTIERQSQARGWRRWQTGLALLAFLAIAGFFLVSEHRAHAFGALPYLLLLLCPLLHLFLHRRHGGGRVGHGEGPSQHHKGEKR